MATITLSTPPPQSSSPSRQFTPLVLYNESELNHHQKQSIQHDQNEEKEIVHRRLKISDMLDRNAQWWNDHESITHTFPSEGTSQSRKKGFVRVDNTNGTTMGDEDENNMIDMLPSISTSSTSSNSSNDSSDSVSTTAITAPIKTENAMSVSTLMFMPPHTPSSPTIIPLEPKTDMPPPPLYQARRSFAMDRPPQHHQYHQHRHSTAGIYQHPISPTSLASPSIPEKTAILNSPLSSPTSVSSSLLQSYNPSATSRSAFSSASSSPGARNNLLLENAHDYYNDLPTSTDTMAPPLPLTKADTDAGINKKRRRGNLPKHVTEFLRFWLLQHKKHPYPTERQKLELAQRTGLAVNQISNWFINARRRILQPMLETEQLLAQQQQQQQHHHHHQQHLYTNHRSSSQQHPNYHHPHSTISYPTSTSSTMEEKKRRQLDIYAYHGFTETTHDTQRWSVRRTKLPNIEIPEKDQHIFATVP